MKRDTSPARQLCRAADPRSPPLASANEKKNGPRVCRLHFLKRPCGKSPIGKSPSDYEAWKPSRRARGALRAGGDSFRLVDEGAGNSSGTSGSSNSNSDSGDGGGSGSSSNSSLLRKIRSPDNCDLSSREGNPDRGEARTSERDRPSSREEKDVMRKGRRRRVVRER